MTAVRRATPEPECGSQAFKTGACELSDHRATKHKITAEGWYPNDLVLTRSRSDGFSLTFFCAHADHKLTALVSGASAVRSLFGGWLASQTGVYATNPTKTDTMEVKQHVRC